MITFPPEFTALKYPGYFWNTKDQQLYSIKVSGILRPLKFQRANQYNHGVAGYQISVNGRKKHIPVDLLKKCKKPSDSVIPVQLNLF
jgi:hypothetical protein